MKVRDRMGDALAAAWREAALRQSDAAWAQALLDRGNAPPDLLAPLLELVPATAAEAHVAALLRKRHTAASEQHLLRLPRPWSEAFTARAFEHGTREPTPSAWLRPVGRHGAPSFAARAAEAADRLDPATAAARHAREAAALLAFRRDLLSTLTKDLR